jgi:hypothetical protein
VRATAIERRRCRPHEHLLCHPKQRKRSVSGAAGQSADLLATDAAKLHRACGQLADECPSREVAWLRDRADGRFAALLRDQGPQPAFSRAYPLAASRMTGAATAISLDLELRYVFFDFLTFDVLRAFET